MIHRLKHKFIDTLALALFCILLPYALAAVTGKVGKREQSQVQENISVLSSSEFGIEKISGEDYLIGAMAASVSPEMEPEMLRAQAVVLRTNLYEAYMRAGDKARQTVDVSLVGQDFLTPWQMQLLWGGDYEKYYGSCKKAVEETRGEIITYEGIPVKVPFFYVSSGMTRDGLEAFGTENYPYLASVDCPQDRLCSEYSVLYTFSETVFQKKMMTLFPSFTGNISELTLQRDSSGYVQQVTDTGSGDSCAGEAMRELFNLPSSCFEWQQEEGQITLTIRGIGHGVGLSQYGANVLAGQGKDHKEILKTFFQGVEIQEIEKNV